MSMLPTHFDAAIELAPHYILTSIGLTIAISTLAGINFAMMGYKMNQIKKMNSVKSNSSAIFGGIFAAFTPVVQHVQPISSNFRSGWRIIIISNARTRIEIYFSWSIDIFNLLDNKRITK